MAYPKGLTQVTIVAGTSIDWFSQPVKRLSVTIRPVLPNLQYITHEPTGTTMIVSSKTFTSDDTGYVSLQVPHSNQPGWVDGTLRTVPPWPYHCLLRATLEDGTTVEWPKTFTTKDDQDVVDLDLIEDGNIATGVSAPVPAVTSVNGMTGAVQLDAITSGNTAPAYDDTPLQQRLQALELRNIALPPRRNLVSIIGDSFSSTGYGTNYGHIWHTVALAHADGTLVGNYARTATPLPTPSKAAPPIGGLTPPTAS